MLFGAHNGSLELRHQADGSRILAGRFPYGETELAPGRRERFEARAFASRIEAGADLHLLSQHDFAKPLASRAAGTLTVEDTEQGVAFEARITSRIANTSHGRDALAMIEAGLAVGISPGFQVAQGGERVTRSGDGVLRTIRAADLHEMSVVTRPAYPAAQIEARNWSPRICAPARQWGAYRWR